MFVCLLQAALDFDFSKVCFLRPRGCWDGHYLWPQGQPLSCHGHPATMATVNHTAIRGASDQEQTNVTFEDGPFAWSSTEQGAVLGSYFVGYLLTQVSNCHF